MFDSLSYEKFELTRGILKGLVVFVVAIGIFFSAILLDLLIIAGVSSITRSGLFGICGPYGSGPAIWLQAGLALAGIPAGIWLTIIAIRRTT